MSPSDRFYQRLHRKDIPALDAFRAIGAMLVLGFHGVFPWIPGRVGVLIFFTLSGFLITTLLLKEFSASSTINLLEFYRRRAFRIFPAFYVFWIISVAIAWPAVNWKLYGPSFFYVSNYATALFPSVPIDLTWSLGIEEQFYLLWPFIVLTNGSNLKRLSKIAMTVIACVWTWKIVLVYGLHTNGWYADNAFDTRFGDLLAGCLLAVIVYRRPAIPAWLFHPLATIPPLLALVAASYLDAIGRHVASLTFAYTPAALATALLILQCILLTERGVFSVLENKAVKYLGRISYSLYLFHGFAIVIAEHTPLARYSMRVLVSVVLAILFAVIAHHAVEKPFLRLRDRKRSRNLQVAAA